MTRTTPAIPADPRPGVGAVVDRRDGARRASVGQLTDGLTGVLIPAPEPRWWDRIDRPEPDSSRRSTDDPETSHRQVTIGHQQLRVDVRAGDGTGTPLLMCGGIGASFEVLQPLVDALDPGIDIIRFDAPGVGGSPVGALPHGFPQLARMLDRMLDELGYHRVDVLGFSWGGALAQQFAVQHAGRCRRLVLISTNTGVLSVPAAPVGVRENGDTTWFRRLRRGDGRAPCTAAIPAPAPTTSGDCSGHTRVAVSGPGYLYQLAATASWSSLPFLTLIRQPVLVMGGDDDPIVPVANARILANAHPERHPARLPRRPPRTTHRGHRLRAADHPIPDPPTTVAVDRSDLRATHHLSARATDRPDRD